VMTAGAQRDTDRNFKISLSGPEYLLQGTYQIPFVVKATDDYFGVEKTWNRTFTVVIE